MKKILITGASRGLGKAFVEELKNDYEIISTARSGDVTIHGDLSDNKFVQMLIDEVDADIIINNAGLISNDLKETYKINNNTNKLEHNEIGIIK